MLAMPALAVALRWVQQRLDSFRSGRAPSRRKTARARSRSQASPDSGTPLYGLTRGCRGKPTLLLYGKRTASELPQESRAAAKTL
jgi:hypothetical protein